MLYLQKKKLRHEGVQILKNVEELKDTQVDRGGNEIFTQKTPTKTIKKKENK